MEFQAHGEFPGKFESTNLSLEILSMETGRSPCLARGHLRLSLQRLEQKRLSAQGAVFARFLLQAGEERQVAP